MANYYYIKYDTDGDQGTATGDGGVTTTMRTGAWSSTTSLYYSDITTMLAQVTTAPTDGDIIFFSHLSDLTSATSTGNNNLNDNGAFGGAGLLIISVDDSNQDQYKPGASENYPTVDKDYFLLYNGTLAGVSLSTGDNTINLTTTTSAQWNVQDLTLTAGTTTDTCIHVKGEGDVVNASNVWLNATVTTNYLLYVVGACSLHLNGGGITSSNTNNLFWYFGGNGGATLTWTGGDLSNFSGTLFNKLADGTQDNTTMELRNCLLNPNVTLHDTFVASNCEFRMFGCDDSTGAALHRFYINNAQGTASNNDSCYVTANPAWFEGSAKSSIKVVTTAYCTMARPFIFELPARYVDLSDTASDKVTINMVTDMTLTDTEITFSFVYPDGTTPVQGNWITSSPVSGTWRDPLSAGTTLSTSSLGASDWTGEPASPNFYKVDLDTSSVAGDAFVVSIRCEVTRTSITGTTGGYLYIDPVLTVGT